MFVLVQWKTMDCSNCMQIRPT